MKIKAATIIIVFLLAATLMQIASGNVFFASAFSTFLQADSLIAVSDNEEPDEDVFVIIEDNLDSQDYIDSLKKTDTQIDLQTTNDIKVVIEPQNTVEPANSNDRQVVVNPQSTFESANSDDRQIAVDPQSTLESANSDDRQVVVNPQSTFESANSDDMQVAIDPQNTVEPTNYSNSQSTSASSDNQIYSDNIFNIDLDLIATSSKADSGIYIELIYADSIFKYNDEYITPQNHVDAHELYIRKINGSYIQKRQIMEKCLSAGGSYKTAVLYTMPMLQKVVDTAIKKINAPAKNSTMDFNPNAKPMFTIKREKEGKKVNEEKLYRQIYAALSGDPHARVIVKPDSVAADITADDNVQTTRLRSRHTTSYASSNSNRKSNIKLALKKVNGSVLKAGEEFSFNKTVGNRTEKNGFKESAIIIGGKYENGIGGGVCQVSTTLYNAALLAGQTITSARNHSLECTYELPSFDAMVNSGSQDLRFKNTDSTSVFIRAYGDESKAVVEFYGAVMPYTIKRHSEVVYRKDPPAYKTIIDTEFMYHAEGTESGTKKFVRYSHGEMKSVGYLLYYDRKGFLVKKVKIREDKYKSVEGLIAIAP